MRIGTWNIRGLNHPTKMLALRRFIRGNKLSICGVMEVKMEEFKFDAFLRRSYRNWRFVHNFSVLDNQRLLVMWDPILVDVQPLMILEQCIHLRVVCKATGTQFFCTYVYGLYTVVTRRGLWEALREFGVGLTDPWMVLGDFNAIRSLNDKLGGVELSRYFLQDLDDTCTACCLTDSPSFGPWHTWRGPDRILAKLDRVLINDYWSSLSCTAYFLGFQSRMDHRACYVDLFRSTPTGIRPFRFQNMWTNHPDCRSIVETCWSVDIPGYAQYRLAVKLKSLKAPLRELNKRDLSHIGERALQANQALDDAIGALNMQNVSVEDWGQVRLLSEKAWFLQDAERKFIAQKLKTNHLILSDKGSRYFHDLARSSGSYTPISAVYDSAGTLVSDSQQLGTLFVDFYTSLFGTSRSREPIDTGVLHMGPTLDTTTAGCLAQCVPSGEIRQAVFSMADEKAPGPDGFTPAFFKAYWSIVGDDVCAAVQDFFDRGQLLRQMNATSVSLIPKKPNDLTVADFRPIACCNVSYKIITKVIATRLARAIPSIIDQAQGGFVEGRLLSDNTLLAEELIRGYARKSNTARCMIMVDIRKAFDTVSWDFLREVLCGLGFPERFINWVMLCVSTPMYSVKLNGSLHGYFEGKRGLRQGDPMSPMLFVLCMEYFSRLLRARTATPFFTYHPRCEPLRITHLAFADDLMLFSKGDRSSVDILMKVLNEFECTSGLAINPNKSSMYSVGVEEDLSFTGIPQGSLPVRYLGIPLDSQKLKVSQFSALTDAINSYISSWKGHTLSYAGRLELIKSVIQGVASFWLQQVFLPVGVVDHITAICRRFLWGGKACPVAWEKVCRTIEEGGLGLKDLQTWNKALLAKQIWNFHTKKDTLWVRWVHSFYIQGQDFWTWKPGKWNSSAFIRKLMSVRDELLQSLGGRDATIMQLAQWARLRGLDSSKVYLILRPKLPPQRIFRLLWKGAYPPKFSFIAWKAVRERLPTRARLRNYYGETCCPFCRRAPETSQHLFFHCEFSRHIWDYIKERVGFHRRCYTIRGAARWIIREAHGVRRTARTGMLALLTTLYYIWTARNALVMDGVSPTVDGVRCRILTQMYTVLYRLYPGESI